MAILNFKNPQQIPIIHFSADQTQDTVTVLRRIQTNAQGEKEYVYEINLEIDFIQAYRNAAFSLVTKATKQLPPDDYESVANISFSEPEERDWSSVIQFQKAKKQEVSDKLNSSLVLWTNTVNLLSQLTVTETSALKALVEADQIFEEERVTIKILKGSTAKDLGYTVEKHDQDTTSKLQDFVLGTQTSNNVNDLDISTKRQDLIYGFLQDPGNFAQKRASNLLTQKFRLNGLVNLNGSSGNSAASAYNDLQSNPIFLSLKRSLESITSDGLVQEDELGAYQVIETYKTKLFRTQFTLSEVDIGTDDFYLIFEVRTDARNQLAQKVSIKVPHAENTKYTTFPVKAPAVTLISSPGDSDAVFSIKQVDDNGVFVRIYKNEKFQHKQTKTSDFTLIDTINVSNNGSQNNIFWEDPTYTPGLYTTYRMTSLNAYELESAAFSSVVVFDPTIKPYNGNYTEVINKPLNCNLYTQYDRDRPNILLVYIENIPYHVVSFSIIRQNISNPEEDYTTIADMVNIITDETQKSFQFEDTTLTDREMYEYFVVFWSNDGIQRLSTTRHRIIYFYADKESGITTLGNPTITDENGLDITFEITKVKNPYEADLIQQAITLQGNKDEFQGQLTLNAKRLSPIFQTSMYRTNTESGEVEFYGIIDNDVFIDSKYGPKNGVEPLESGVKYIYTAVTHRRDPETLFYDNIVSVTNSITNQTYTYKPAFTQHPLRIRDGLIVTETFLNNQPFDIFTFGDVVDVDQIEISVPIIPPEVINATARIISGDKVLVTWALSGDSKLVDHFMIYMNHNGIDAPVGISRAFNNDLRYEFVDVLDNGESGIIRYKIIPVFFDYTNGKTTITNQVLFSD